MAITGLHMIKKNFKIETHNQYQIGFAKEFKGFVEWLNVIYALNQYVYLVNIPEPVQYHIYTLAFPFDLKCESATFNNY